MWKWLFFVLLLTNLIGIGIIVNMLTSTYDGPIYTQSSTRDSDIEINVSNEMIETVLNNEIDEDDLTINITTDGIQMFYTTEVFNRSIDTVFDLEPVSTDGDIVFHVQNINIGNLPLSQEALYTLMRTMSDTPEGVYFSEERYELIVDSSLLTIDGFSGNLFIENINYENDEWTFSIQNLNF